MKYKNYINNEWVDARDGSTFDVENPFTEEIIAQVPTSSASDVNAAVSAAKSAWKNWKILGSCRDHVWCGYDTFKVYCFSSV